MWVTPRSSARWMVRIDSASSRPPPVVYVPAMVMAPRPIRETSRPPSDACFIRYSLWGSSCVIGRGRRAWSVLLGGPLQNEDRDLAVGVLLVDGVVGERLDGS